jgi:large subunit ribosomal protein L29
MAKIRDRIAEFKILGDAEMIEALAEARKEMFNLRFQSATGQLDNSARLGHVRKNVARLSTFIRQREIAAHEAEQESDQS